MIDITIQKYMIQRDSGRGANPDDVGKPVIIYLREPDDLEDNLYVFSGHNTLWSPHPDVEFYINTKSDNSYKGIKYFKSHSSMFREPTQEEIIKWNLKTESLLTTIL
jgi:hypothetical protein